MADESSNFELTSFQASNANFDENHGSSLPVLKEDTRACIPKHLEKVLESAQQILSRKDYGKALSHFAYIVHCAPSLSKLVHDDFLFALKHWSNTLAEHGKIEDLVKCLEEGIKLFPNSAEIANNVGAALFRVNKIDEAALYFRRALKIDPHYGNAKENLDSIANFLVERWHFRMLNDTIRNQAYKSAIDRAIQQGCDSILDIGSGTCILSMFAVQSGAKGVYACEMSKSMYELSLDVLAANHMQDSVHVINKKSHDLVIPNDLPCRVPLIVTETLDCGLLGEGIIETLTHAKRELLATSHQIIPAGAMVYAQIVECEKIRRYSRVNSKILGRDISSVQIKGGEVSETGFEPYTTEDMSSLKYASLSEPFRVTSYDFQMSENYIIEAEEGISVSIINPGSIDAIIMWFELKLDAHEMLSSAPGRSVCWEQAVYPCQLSKGERMTDAGDEVVINVRLTSSAIFLEIDRVKFQNSQNLRSLTLPYQDICKLNDNELNNSIYTALKEAFMELNLSTTQNLSKDLTLEQCQDITLKFNKDLALKSAQDSTVESDLTKDLSLNKCGCIVVCSSPTFNPLLALWAGFSPVVCISNQPSFEQLLETLANHNECFKTLNDDGEYVKTPSEDKCSGKLFFTNKSLEDLVGSQDCQVLLVDAVEPTGLLRQGVIEDIVLAKGCVLPKNTGIVLPRKIEVWGMLISSNSLCQKSHVTGNDVTLGLDIAEHMNTFQVRNQIDVDVKSNPFSSLTNPRLLLNLDLMKLVDDEELFSLLNTTCETLVAAVKDGQADGLMYWFILDLTEDIRLSTGPESGSHFNQVVMMFKEKLAVVSGQDFLVKTSCKNSCITANVVAK